MRKLKYYIIDAFTNEPGKGNPAAVCLLEEQISDERMLNIAKIFGLSETAFLKKREEAGSFAGLRPNLK